MTINTPLEHFTILYFKRSTLFVGINGLPGIEGTRGRTGETSLKGDPGNCDYKNSQKEHNKVEQKKEFGLVYTIWGSAACPDTSNMVYSGKPVSFQNIV